MKKNIQKNQLRSFDNSNLLRQFRALNKRQHQASFATRKTYRQSTRSILRYCYQTFNIQKIENIKDKHIRSYIESQEDKSVSCLKKELSGFRYYVDMLDRDGKECHFHADNDDLGIGGTKEFRQRTAATPTEIERIHDYADTMSNRELGEVLHTATDLCANFGLRSKEVFCLKVCQIRSTANQIQAGQPAYLALDGTGCKGGRKRQIGPLNEQQQAAMVDIAANIPQSKYVDDFLLTDRSVPHALEKRLSWWHGLFSRHGEEFSDERRREHRPEWDRSVTPHDLRRTFAKEYYHELREQGIQPRPAFGKVAEALGHGKNRMELAKHYLDDAALEEIENDPA